MLRCQRHVHPLGPVLASGLFALFIASCAEQGVEETHKTKDGMTFRIDWKLDSENFPMFDLHVIDKSGREIHTEDYHHLTMGYNEGFTIKETNDEVRVYTNAKPPELLTTYRLK